MIKKRRKVGRGSSRMLEQGYKSCQIWFDPSELEIVRQLASRERLPLATWARRLLVCHAADVLKMAVPPSTKSFGS